MVKDKLNSKKWIYEEISMAEFAERFIDDNISLENTCNIYKCSRQSLYRWVQRF